MTDEQIQAKFDAMNARIEANQARIEAGQAILNTHIEVSTERYRITAPLMDKVNETWDWKNRANGSLSTIRFILLFLGGTSFIEIVLLVLKR